MRKQHTQVSVLRLKENKLLHQSPHVTRDEHGKLVYNASQLTNPHISTSTATQNGGGRKFPLRRNNSFDELFPPHNFSANFRSDSSKDYRNEIPRSIDQSSYMHFISKSCEKKEVHEFIETIKGPLIVNCHFANSRTGIVCTVEANILIINCSFENCGDSIKVSRYSKALIYHNRLSQSVGSAICLKSGSEAVVMGCDIHGASDYGIEVRKNTVPYIMANKIHTNRKCGVSFLSNGGWVQYNDISYNKTGISLLHSANPVIRSNSVHNNSIGGISISERSVGVVEDNIIYNNQHNNISISKFSSPVIAQNFIIRAGHNGILATGMCRGTIANNILEDNCANGLVLLNGSLPCIYGNQICNNSANGILVSTVTDRIRASSVISLDPEVYGSAYDYQEQLAQGSENGIVENEELNDNDEDSDGINRFFSGDKWIKRRSNLLRIEFNSIYFNKEHGIHSNCNCAIELHSNAVHANRQGGIDLSVPGLFGPTYGFPKMPLSREGASGSGRDNGRTGLLKKAATVTTMGRGAMRTFYLAGSADRGHEDYAKQSQYSAAVRIFCQDGAYVPYALENRYRVRQRTLGQILRNSITDNGGHGVNLNVTRFTSGRFVLIGNGIFDNGCHGLQIQSECEAMNNDVIGNIGCAIKLMKQSWSMLTGNRILSVERPAVSVEHLSVSTVCRANVVYTTTLETDVFRVYRNIDPATGLDSVAGENSNISSTCFAEFRLANSIEYFPSEVDHLSTSRDFSRAFSNTVSTNQHKNWPNQISRQSPLRPIILRDDRCSRHVSVALSQALQSLSNGPRSEICTLL